MRLRAVALVALAAVGLTGCELGGDPRPGPSPTTGGPAASATSASPSGLDLAVVLPPPGGLAELEGAALRAAADEVEATPGVGRVRILAAPDEAFRRDELGFAAERGSDLVCTVGDAGADDIVALAPVFPRTRFCLIDAPLVEPPGNAFSVTWNLEQGAFLAGAAAAMARPDAGVGIVARSPGASFGAVRAGIDAGVRTVRPGLRVAVGAVPIGPDAPPVAQAAAQVAAELRAADQPVRAVIPYGGVETVTGVVEVFTPDGFLIGWAVDLTDVAAPERVVVSVVKAYDEALRAVVRHVSAGDAVPTLDLSNGGFVLVPGGATSAFDAIRPRLEQLRDELAAGRRAPTAPPDDPSPQAAPAAGGR